MYTLERISYSKLSTYKQCPKRWKYTYILDRVLIQPSYALVAGSFVHLCLEEFYKLEPAERTVEGLRLLAKIVFDTFSEEDEEYKLLSFTDEDVLKFKHYCWEFLLGIWELENPHEVDVVATEQEVSVDFDGVTFYGIIDRLERVNGKLYVSDYKSGKPPQKRYRKDKLVQIILYAAAIEKVMNERPEKARLLFLGNEIISIRPTDFLIDQELKNLREVWDKLIYSIENDDFKAQTGPLCGWCPHADICEEGQKYLIQRDKEGKLRKDAPSREMLVSLGLIQP